MLQSSMLNDGQKFNGEAEPTNVDSNVKTPLA